MLLQLRDYIRKEGVVSLQQLSRFFDIPISALTPMLTIWVNKGVLRAHEPPTGCRTQCRGCVTSPVVFYEAQN